MPEGVDSGYFIASGAEVRGLSGHPAIYWASGHLAIYWAVGVTVENASSHIRSMLAPSCYFAWGRAKIALARKWNSTWVF